MRKLIFILMIGLLSTAVAEAQYPTDKETSVITFIQKAEESEMICKIQPQLRRVYIDPIAWVYFNYDIKKKFTKVCAMYMNMLTEQNAEFVKIYNYQTGKKLARYNSFLGFKVF